MSHRISKHDLKHDEFADDMMKTMSFFRKYSTESLAAAVAIVVIAVGLAFFAQSRAKNEREASMMLNTVHAAYYSGQSQQAIDGYKELISRFGSTNAGREAMIYQGNIHFQQRNYDEALKAFARCVKAGPKNPFLLSGALSGEAACYEQQNDYAKAGDKYLEIVRRLPQHELLASGALMQAGRCFTEAKLLDKARASYQQIIDKYSDGGSAREAKTALNMLKKG